MTSLLWTFTKSHAAWPTLPKNTVVILLQWRLFHEATS